MPPKLQSDNGHHIVIRPLAYVAEKDLIAYAKLREFPIIPCNLCGSQENLKRQEANRMIAEWDQKFPGRTWNVFGALNSVVPSHLMDRDLFDFGNLRATGSPDPTGDTAFDSPEFTLDPSLPRFGEDEEESGTLSSEKTAPRVIPLSRI